LLGYLWKPLGEHEIHGGQCHRHASLFVGGVGLVPLPRRRRSARRHQLALADLRRGQPTPRRRQPSRSAPPCCSKWAAPAHAWVTAVPLGLAPRRDFHCRPHENLQPRACRLSGDRAASFEAKIAAGGTPAEMKMWQTLLLNNQINAAVTGAFLVLVTLVVAANARVWWQILVTGKKPALREDADVTLAPANT